MLQDLYRCDLFPVVWTVGLHLRELVSIRVFVRRVNSNTKIASTNKDPCARLVRFWMFMRRLNKNTGQALGHGEQCAYHLSIRMFVRRVKNNTMQALRQLDSCANLIRIRLIVRRVNSNTTQALRQGLCTHLRPFNDAVAAKHVLAARGLSQWSFGVLLTDAAL